MMAEDGYLAEWEQLDDHTYLLREYNCAIHDIAHRYRQACASELAFLHALLPEAEIRREAYIMGGDSACGYRITLHSDG